MSIHIPAKMKNISENREIRSTDNANGGGGNGFTLTKKERQRLSFFDYFFILV